VITRVRVESSAKTADEVRKDLVDTGMQFTRNLGGSWIFDQVDGNDFELQTTAGGWWGRLTLKRIVMQLPSEPVAEDVDVDCNVFPAEHATEEKP
jgi:hypothetical protein